MPKKFAGENSKAVVARQRKEAVREAEKQKKQQEAEDALWEDDDKKLKKRINKKEEMEKKKQEQLSKKAEAKELLEKEMSSIGKVKAVPAPPKITRAQIQSDSEKRAAVAKKVVEEKPKETHVEKPLEENLNRVMTEEVATTVDEAIAMLTDTQLSADKHPEKRKKAAFLAFEEKYLPILKQENPSLRMSQLKQMIFKEWQKSSENPMNKPT